MDDPSAHPPPMVGIPPDCAFVEGTDTRPKGTLEHGKQVCVREKGRYLRGSIRGDDIVGENGEEAYISVNIDPAYRGDRPHREFAIFKRRDIALVVTPDEPTNGGSIKKRVSRRGRKLPVTRRRRGRGRKLNRLRSTRRHGGH